MGLFSSRKSSVKKEAKFAEPPAAAPAPAAVAAASSDDLSLQKTEGFRRGSALATKQDLEAATLADFDVVRVLGRGAFGKVSLVQHKTSHEKYALKTLNKKMLVAVKQSKGAITEREVLKQKGHPCIVRLYWAFQDDESLHMVLDYLPGGDLYDRIEELREAAPGTGFPVARARLYAAEIASALEHLHSRKIVYRDLKPENVLLDSEGHVRITDFGLAKDAMELGDKTHTFCGTPDYLAPEIIKGAGHGRGVDWWSLGTMIYEMLGGLPPFYSENFNVMYDRILRKTLEFNPDDRFGSDARDLLTGLLQKSPELRLGSSERDGAELREHAWFAPIDWAKLEARELEPSFKPNVKSATDTSNFDDEFTSQPIAESVMPETALGGKGQQYEGFTYVDKGHLG